MKPLPVKPGPARRRRGWLSRWAWRAVVFLPAVWPLDAFGQSAELQRLWKDALTLSGRGANEDAAAVGRQAVELAERESGPEHPTVAHGLLILGGAYRELARYGDAEPLVTRALALLERAFGPMHAQVATALNNLAFLHETQGRYGEAEPLYRRSLEIRERTNGPQHPGVATILNNLAALHRAQGRYAEARASFERSIAIQEHALGREHPEVATTVNNLAEILRAQGYYAQAAPLYERVLAIWRQSLGPEHPRVAIVLNNLAELHREQGRYALAEGLYKRALIIRERARGHEHPDVAVSVNNLAALYRAQGRYHDAEALYRRALAIREKAFGPAHPDVARTLNNLARVYRAQRRFAEAEPLFKRAQAVWEATIGPAHPDLGYSLDNLARMYRQQGRFAEAEPLFRRSTAIWRAAFGAEHPTVARALLHMAELKAAWRQGTEAASLFDESVAMYQRLLGADHPQVAEAEYRYAEFEMARGRISDALARARRATAIMRGRIAVADGDPSDGSLAEQRMTRESFSLHVAILNRAIEAAPDRNAQRDLLDESFQVGQLAQASTTARALSGMAARFAAGDDALARLVRERQDLAEEWKRIDAELVKAASASTARRNVAAEARDRARLGDLDRLIAGIDTRLAAEFPRYAEVANPRPLRIDEARAFLRPGEALVNYLVASEAGFVWVVTGDRAVVRRLPVEHEAVSAAVAWLREGLDPTLSVMRAGRIPRYDLATSHELYRRILGPVAETLAGAETLLVVPDGPLQSLPFGVLVTEPPSPAAGKSEDYRGAAWLGWKRAISTLPSISSLAALRGLAAESRAPEPFFGVGDPLPPGAAGDDDKGGGALPPQLEALRRLARLPNAADELGAMGRAVGAGPRDLLLGGEATESNLRRLALERYRIVAFATHGLVAGDLRGLTEPALVLTPSARPTPDDDGLLTASEIAQLRFNADWVVLSACNTAADDGTPGADGLSGLAKAFFYAGSRALLVSHWPVDSAAAVKLTTSLFATMAADPALGRAQALRGAMAALAVDRTVERFAHPMFWAPFVVVGESGALRR